MAIYKPPKRQELNGVLADKKRDKNLLDPRFIPSPLGERTYHRSVASVNLVTRTHRRTWQVFRAFMALLWNYLKLRFAGELTGESMGRLVCEACERQGVLWVKAGQLLAMRNDIFSADFCSQLSRLHDRATGFPPEEAVKEVERELGAPISRYFSEFDRTPIAAASIAQVHLARLKQSGTAVAVKIQRPDAESTFRADTIVFHRIVRFLKWLKFKPLMRWDDLAWELEHVMHEELDFRVEATSMRRMKKNLRPHKVYVPFLFSQFTTRRLLVMEFVHGVLMADVLRIKREDPDRLAAWMEANKIKPNKVGQRLLMSYLQQLFEDRLFHADMHPGNLILLRNSRLALIDFGSIGFMERDLLRKYDGYVEALGEGNFSKAIDMLMMTTNSLPPGNLSYMKDELLQITKDWESRCRVDGLSYDDTSASRLLDDTVRQGMEWGIDQNWTFLKVIRSWATMDVSLRSLLSDSDLKQMLSRYYVERQERQRTELLQTRPIGPGQIQRALEFGETGIENVLLRGTIMRRMGQVFEGATNKINQFFRVGFSLSALGCVGLAGFLVFLLAHQRWDFLPSVLVGGKIAIWLSEIPPLDMQVWSIAFLLSMYWTWTLWGLRGRFGEAEDNTSFT